MSTDVIKASMFSVLGFFGVANYFRGLSKAELDASKKRRQERIASSPQFHQGRVIGRMPKTSYKGSKTVLNLKSFFNRANLKPRETLPHAQLDLTVLKKRSKALRVTWLGHSSLFLEMNYTRILIDPVFEFAAPLIAKPWFNRNVNTPIKKEDLPLPDVIVISHDHYDHLEKSTIKFYADKPVRFFVPLGVGRHLENWGIRPEKIQEFDWWESAVINGVEMISAPANHNSGRTGLDNDKTLWCSWAFRSQQGSVFFSGDTAYDAHFSQVHERLGKFDIAFIEVAANVKDGNGYPVENCGHMQARHTMQAFLDLGAEKLFPVHWSTFELFTHKWDEPMADLIEEFVKVGANLVSPIDLVPPIDLVAPIDLVTPMVGETVYLKQVQETNFWWTDLELSAANTSKNPAIIKPMLVPDSKFIFQE